MNIHFRHHSEMTFNLVVHPLRICSHHSRRPVHTVSNPRVHHIRPWVHHIRSILLRTRRTTEEYTNVTVISRPIRPPMSPENETPQVRSGQTPGWEFWRPSYVSTVVTTVDLLTRSGLRGSTVYVYSRQLTPPPSDPPR